MPEHQTIEWKESWHDEYLKWICGYANAYGGTLFIGKDDNGAVKGISNSQKLLKNIPDKITDTMGIIADVNLLYEGEFEYLEIMVEKYPSLISYHGKYYYRSGSTMRTIDGMELEKTLLKNQGRTWDSVPLLNVAVNDLRQDAIDLFKEKAIARGRLTAEDVKSTNQVLLENLRLFEDDKLIRAAVMAFHKDPEKWVAGAYIKIGFFVTDSDLKYQDEVHGSLIEQVDKTMDLVYTKYLKALIDYEGIQRIEQFMFHPDAFREILLNAIVHKDYSGCNPIQISVYEDKIYIWNDGTMPENLSTTKKLFEKHSSKPFNPRLAGIFFKSGMIEAWGRGFDKIKEACAKYNAPLPEYDISNVGIMVLCKPCKRYMRLLNESDSVKNNSVKKNDRIMTESLTEKEEKTMAAILSYLQDNNTISNEIGRNLTEKSETTVKRYLGRLCEVGLLEQIGTTKNTIYRKVTHGNS
jgi:ATP-dependent DNA helicase RecG